MKKIFTGLMTAGLAFTLSACFVPLPFPVPVPGPEVPIDPIPAPPEIGEGAARFTDQTIEWEDCMQGFQCAYVLAPMDWQNIEETEAIELFLVKQPALKGNSHGSLFVNPGGPGASGTQFVAESIEYAVGKPLQDSFDVIGWDPRGVGESSAVECLSQQDMDEYLFGDPRPFAKFERGSDEWIAAVRAEERAFGEACLEATGDLLGYVDTVSTVKDLDLLRHLVGDEKLNYLGYSYGTFIGALYADNFPNSVGHLVLDGAIAPDTTVSEVVLMQQQGFENAARAYLKECLNRSNCPFSGSVEESMKSIGKMIDEFEKNPRQAKDGRWVSSGTFITAIILPLYNEGNWPFLDDLFEETKAGGVETAQFLADFYYSRSYGHYEDNSTEAFAAINCLDYPKGGNADEMRAEARELAEAAPIFGRYAGYGDISCEEWPVESDSVRGPVTGKGADPILVIGTTGDPATPYAWAQELAEDLESGVLITNNGEGHGAYTSGNSCIDKTVEDYFLKGTVPDKDPNC